MGVGTQKNIGRADTLKPNIVLQIISLALLGVFLWGCYLSFSTTVFKITSFIAALSVAYACLRFMACATAKPTSKAGAEPDNWPFYTVLVPLFHEANMVPQLMSALAKLDYPHHKLEIFIICESVDPKTIAAARKRMGGIFHLIVVPSGTPQTKPRALNFAMQRARGEFVTIYDAEDIPHPGQLKAAVKAFAADAKLGAVQAPLDYANAHVNPLTRQFALEYAALFHVWLPFLTAAKLPFPLGGTSNHMRREALEQIEGWDSYNVTEDADLSFRLAAHGWELGYILPPTQEEAVSSFRAWHFQRARWMKGFIQTWQCHMQAPFAPGGLRGAARFFTLQLTLGLTIINALFHLPVMAGAGVYILYLKIAGQTVNIPAPFIISLCLSYGAGMYIGAEGAIRSGKPALLLSVPFMPLYWFALCAPTLRALWELKRNPFHWHKTEHGVTPATTLKQTASTPISTHDYYQ